MIDLIKNSVSRIDAGRLLLSLGVLVVALVAVCSATIQTVQHQVIFLDDGAVRIARGNYSPDDLTSLLGSPLHDADKLELIDSSSFDKLYLVKRTKHVEIIDKETSFAIDTTALTVGEMIWENPNSIKLSELDRVEPPLSTHLTNGLTVHVTRVNAVDVTVEEPVEPPFQMIADAQIIRGKVVTVKEGKPGVKEVTYRKFYKDGQFTVKKKLSETVKMKPESGVKHVGSRVMTLSRSGYRGKRMLEMEATAYDAGPQSTGKWSSGGRTASGKKVKFGMVAVDPRVIPLGTKLFIEGYGYAVAEDTGGAIKGLRIDLFYESRREALQFGRRKVKVYIIDDFNVKI
jgi:3D (Asp-Asp-Asp) domain-containing protein